MASTAPIKIPILGVDMYTKEFNKLTKGVDAVGKKLTSMGKTLTASVTAPIIGAATASVMLSKDFNKAMANVGTLVPGNLKQLNKFKQGVMDVSILVGETDFSSMADGLYETISAFGDGVDPMKKFETAAVAATAGVSTTKEALSLLSAVTKGYGDTSDEAVQKVSDLSFLTVKLGQTTFPDLAASIGKVVPLTSAMNISQEELFGTFATLTGVTGNAAEVATQFASALGGVLVPTEKLTRFAKKAGYASAFAMVQNEGWVKTLDRIKKETGGSADAIAKLFGRKEAQIAILSLLNKQSGTFASKMKAMGDAAGSTEAAFNEQVNGINKSGVAMDRMIARVKKLAITIGDRLAPVLMRIMDRIDPLLNKLDGLSDAQLDLGIKVAAVAAAIGPLLIVFGKLVSIVSAVISFVGTSGGLAGILAAVTGPIGLVVAGVASLTAAIIYFRDELKPIGQAVIEPLADVFNYFKDQLWSTEHGVGSLLESLKPIISLLAKIIAPVIKLAAKLYLLPLKMIIKSVRVVSDVFATVASAINVVISGVRFAYVWLSKLWTSFTEGTTIGKYLKTAFDWIADAIQGVWDKVTGFLGSLTDVFSGIKGFLDDISDTINEATDAQLNPLMVPSDRGAPLMTDADIINYMQQGKDESYINISFEGMSQGVTARVTEAKGKKARVKNKGPVMDGAF